MARSKRYKDAKDKRDSGRFYALPESVLNGSAYITLSAYARMLLFDLYVQYNGNNNGDLCMAYSMMKLRGWKSTHTLQHAKKELLDSGLIFETRKGARPNKASLYAVTWNALDECKGKFDFDARVFPRGAYRLKDRPPALTKITSLSAAGASASKELMH
jgi:hypothetical protein